MHNASAITPHIGAEPTDSQASTRRFEDQLVYELKIQQMNLVSEGTEATAGLTMQI
jgi:hypothetical protein